MIRDFFRLLVATALFGAGPALAVPLTFELRDATTNEVLLQGSETVTRIATGERRETTYSDGTDRPSPREIYDVDADGRMLTYRYDDAATGEQIEVRDAGNGSLAIAYRERQGAERRVTSLAKRPKMIHGKALPQLILAEWDALSAGDTVTFDLVVPQRLETFSFRIRRVAAGEGGRPTFVVDAGNWLVRQFAPTLTFVFDESSRRVTDFVGPSAVEIGGERHRRVRIGFAPAAPGGTI
jgi:hypothetical protein